MLGRLVLLIVLGFLNSVGDEGLADGCPAGIRVLGDSGNALGISAAFMTEGPMELFIPRYQKVGFRVMRAKDDTPGKAKAEMIEIKVRKVKKPSLLYKFQEPVKLRVWWTDVGVVGPGNSGGFTVQPGQYRFSLLFSASDPSLVEEGTVQLCRVYSEPFTITEPSHFLLLP